MGSKDRWAVGKDGQKGRMGSREGWAGGKDGQ